MELGRPKPRPVQLLTDATRTTTYNSDPQRCLVPDGILVNLHVSAASGTGGLRVRINATEPLVQVPPGESPIRAPLNDAPTAVTATGTYSYWLAPWVNMDAATQNTKGIVPAWFSVSVEHLNGSSYTYSLAYHLLD